MFLRNWGEQGINTAERVLYKLAPALKRSDEADNLFLVARDHSFLKQQDNICYGLSLETLALALRCSIEKKVPQATAEFCIARAQQLEMKKKVSPLDLLQGSGTLEQVMVLADIFQPEISELWYLLVSVYLAQQGKLEKASIVLFQLNKKEHAKFAVQSNASKMRLVLIKALIEFKLLPCEALSAKELVEHHLERGALNEAFEVAKKMLAKKVRTQSGVKQLLQIAHACVTKNAENIYWKSIELARNTLKIHINDAKQFSTPDVPCDGNDPELQNLYYNILESIGLKPWSMEALDHQILKSEEDWAIACYGEETWEKDLVSDVPDGQLCIIKDLLELEQLEEAKDILSVITSEEIKNKALLMIADKYWKLGSSQLANNLVSQILETESCFKNKHVLYDIWKMKIKYREFDSSLWKCVGNLATEFPSFLLKAPLLSATRKLDTYPAMEVLHSLIRMKRLNQFSIYFKYLISEKDRVIILECLKPLAENSVRGITSCLSKILHLYKSNVFYNANDIVKARKEMVALAVLFEVSGKIKVARSILSSFGEIEGSICSATVEKGSTNVTVAMLDNVAIRLKEEARDYEWEDYSAGKDFVYLANRYINLSKKGKVKNVMTDALLVESNNDIRVSSTTPLPISEADLISKIDELFAEIRRYLIPPYEAQAVTNLLSIAESLANNEQINFARDLYSRIIKDIKTIEKNSAGNANHGELLYKTVTSIASVGLVEMAMETTRLMDGFNYKGRALSDLSVVLSDIDCALQETCLDDVNLLLKNCKYPRVEAMISYMKALVVSGQLNVLPSIKKRILDIASESSSEDSRSQQLNSFSEFLVDSGLYKDALDAIEKIPVGAIEPDVLRRFPAKVDEFKSLLELPLSKGNAYILSGKIASSHPSSSKEIFNFMMA